MKRVIAALLLLIVALLPVACTKKGVQSFSIEAGRSAFAQLSESQSPRTVSSAVSLPDGLEFVSYLGDMGMVVAEVINPETHGVLYGVYAGDTLVLPCQYRRIERIGNFYLTHYLNLGDENIEVYDKTGALLVGTEDTSGNAVAVGEDYFVLFTDNNAQLFDKDGVAYFREGILQPSDNLSFCGKYLLSYNSKSGVYCIWDGSNVLRRRFAESGLRYMIAYIGDRFLVVALSEGTDKDYTYIDRLDGVAHYVKQQAWWYLPQTDVLEKTQLSYVVLGIKNAYTPGLSAIDAAAMHLNAGYSAVTVAELDNNKVATGTRNYVIDADARLTVRYPVDINPDAIVYRSDVGFVGSSLKTAAAALYDLAGNLIWQNKEHAYATMTWQGGRLVASYYENEKAVYGAFDGEGNVAVPFRYEYMSPYYADRSVVRVDGKYYVIDGAGTVIADLTLACPEEWLRYGVYTYEDNGLVGIRNFEGDVVVPAEWQRITAIGKANAGDLVVAAQKGTTQTVLVLQ